jgi:two-component system, cell cycle sensor histidine kinase and response regulator CckA
VSSRRTPQETIALLQATLDATHDGILVVDRDRRIVHYNRRYLSMFGFTAEEMETRGIDAIVEALAGQVEGVDAKQALARAILAIAETEVREIVRFADGRVFECFAAPHTVDGRVVGRVTSFRDVTRSTTTEQALEQHRSLLEKAQEVAHVGSWVAELDGSDRLGWSAETHRIFGVGPDEFEGRSESFFSRVHDDDRPAVRAAAAAAIAGTEPYEIEHRILRPDGTVRWVYEKADVVRDRTGSAVRMIGTVQDITARRQLEDQLRQSQKLEAIGRLAGGIAHDLNNALTAIAGYAELALGELSSNDSARGDVDEIRRAAERAASVTRQLLAFSRKRLLEPRLFDVNETITSIGRLLARLLGADIEVEIDLTARRPLVLGDPGQVEQAVINLALNARDAMPEGGRLVLSTTDEEIDEATARANAPMPPGRYLVLRVTDTGHGMSPATQARIFEPFFTTKEVGKGTGLGLSMVYGTMKQIGGFIFVDSAVDRGTTFRLYFRPADQPRPVVQEAPPPSPVQPGQHTVLVVEDETAVRNLVASALRRDGYELLLAATAEEALRVAAAYSGTIDLLLTDAVMPGKSGIELANLLTAARPDLRVIIMSGYTAERLGGLERAQVELLQKPFGPLDLRNRVREALAQPRKISR